MPVTTGVLTSYSTIKNLYQDNKQRLFYTLHLKIHNQNNKRKLFYTETVGIESQDLHILKMWLDIYFVK